MIGLLYIAKFGINRVTGFEIVGGGEGVGEILYSHTHTHTNTHIHTHTDRDTHIQTDRQTHRHTMPCFFSEKAETRLIN